ncbi:tetratricopeptide repeat protein [Nocardia sp. CDC159]|uniref:Tetratricopeptide repeat protein n=1 Tax=Nocardia pulmonis TaxID=2951408 RepID=A0A9X2EA11_9NOCA|nr:MULTISPECIES: tetratricopeptide repeat protein [Nocardia]MCM6776375.1 tetratricopeptide repeat protein [Nocardia pulmonis]MCM6788799.1 tetratricopeptide repeat protein [Nocardia sp. CDC159]
MADLGPSGGQGGSARALFAARLMELWKAAGNPTLQKVATAADARVSAARAPGRGRGVSVQRISDWRSGRNVPSRFETFEPVLLTLITMARAASGPESHVLVDRLSWQRLWKAAAAEPDTTAAAAAEAPALTVTTALRRDTDTFVGRDDEVRRIIAAAGPNRVVSIHTIDGMPGVGKTALVTRAAHLLADRFPDGRFFVELNAHTPGQHPAEPFDVLATLLTDLGIAPGRIPGTLAARRDLWRDRVSDKRVLLVLDDARDHAQIEPLLPTGPGCLTLITSRRRLVALDGALPLALDTLEPDHAADLFCRLAHRDPSGDDIAAVAEIVRHCGYLPLAIGLLAGRLAHHPAWTIADLATDFATTRDRLAELDIGTLAVRAAFTTSYQNLSAQQQILFRRLGLHPGPDLDAYAVAALNDIPLSQARRALEALYTDHLIDETTQGRYRLHDLLREYARTLAEGDPVDDRTRAVDRLFDYYLGTARAATRSAQSDALPAAAPDVSTLTSALAWMRAERANLLACLKFAASDNQLSRVLDLTKALTGELELHGPWQIAAPYLRRGAGGRHTREIVGDASDTILMPMDLGSADYLTDDCSVAADLLQQVLDTHGDIDAATHAFALRILVWTRFLSGDHTLAADVLERALTTFRTLGDRHGEAFALYLLGWLGHLTGDDSVAVELVQQALTIYQDIGNRAGEAFALSVLGTVYTHSGQYPSAADALRRAASIHRETGHRSDEAVVHILWAALHIVTDDYPAAINLLQPVLATYLDMGNRPGEAFILNVLGWIRHVTGDYPAAAELMQQALAIFREIGINRFGVASTLNNLGRVRYLEGDFEAAEDLIRQAQTIYDTIGNRVGMAETVGNLGWVRYLTGDHSGAEALLRRALTMCRDIDHRAGEIESLNRIGALLTTSGDLRRALSTYHEALRLARRVRSSIEQARALEGSARCRVGLGDRGTAMAELREAVRLYERIGAAETKSAVAFLAEL